MGIGWVTSREQHIAKQNKWKTQNKTLGEKCIMSIITCHWPVLSWLLIVGNREL